MVDLMSKNYDFKCRILETRRNWLSNDSEYINSAYVTVYDDHISLRKSGLILSSDLGTSDFYYRDISSLTYDKPGMFHVSYNVNIILYSGEKIVLQKVKEAYYNKIYENWISFKNNPQNEESEDSLFKYAELYKEGLITDEEFALIKQKLIGNPSNNSKNFCKNCGSELSDDSKFCTECGTKVE